MYLCVCLKDRGFCGSCICKCCFSSDRLVLCICSQVRKAGQEALLILLEQDLVAQSDIENKVCPILLDLSAPDSDDEYKVEAVNVS